MAWLLKDVEGKTIVQVVAPACITIQMDETNAEKMTQNELATMVDQVFNRVEGYCGVMNAELCLSGWPMKIPVGFSIQGSWDKLPVDDMEIQFVEDGYFEDRGDDD